MKRTIAEIAKSVEKQGVRKTILDGLVDYENQSKNLNFSTFYDKNKVEEQIAELEKRLQAGEDLPLAGVTVGVKDNIQIKGWPTSCASNMLKGYISSFDADVIEKLKVAGAIFIAKLNMDEFAMGSSTEHSCFGVVKNPADTSRVAGGSSGGSAAAVASGALDVSLGSDTGGSIRQPAAFCGVYGFKPSYGTVSRHGLVSYGSSLDQIGPITNNINDIMVLHSIMSGYDDRDSTSIASQYKQIHKPVYCLLDEASLEGCDKDIIENYQSWANKIKENFETKTINLDFLKDSIAIYYLIATAEVSSNLAKFDGVRYGNRATEFEGYEDLVVKSRTNGFGSEVKRRIILGNFVLSAGYSDKYYKRAKQIRVLFKEKLQTILGENGILLTPTSPTPAFKIGENTGDPMKMYLSDLYTVFLNLVGFPGVSIPSSYNKTKLPLGLQFVSNHLTDDFLLKSVSELETKCISGGK